MAFFGESEYGESWYSGDLARTVEATFTTTARVVRAISESPPVFDSWVSGLAQRFNWLQQGIQTFGLANKIEYATGSDLDTQWGRAYSLLRFTGESDADYRIRLQTYVSVLTGSGTVPNVLPVLNFLIGERDGIIVQTRWPSRVFVTGDTIDILRAMKLHRTLLDAVLPGMFAAGVDWEVLLPFVEFYTEANVVGDRYISLSAVAALQHDIGSDFDAVAAVASDQIEEFDIVAAVQADRVLFARVKAAVRADRAASLNATATVQCDRILGVDSAAAVRIDRSVSLSSLAAARADLYTELESCAAVARSFDRRFSTLASVWMTDIVEFGAVAAVQHRGREAQFYTTARVKKP